MSRTQTALPNGSSRTAHHPIGIANGASRGAGVRAGAATVTVRPVSGDEKTWVLGDRKVNRMGFGSMRLTADPDRNRAIGVLRRAVESGVDHIDTAAFYRSPGGVLGVG